MADSRFAATRDSGMQQKVVVPGAENYKLLSSVGKQIDSLKPSTTGWTFGTGSRDAQSRLYISKEHSRIGHAGQHDTPGPIYNLPALPKGQHWAFGTSGLLERPKQRYPDPVVDLLVHTIDAQQLKFARPKTMVFGTAGREDRAIVSCAPGPTKYSPRLSVSSTVKQSPRFTCTPRRPDPKPSTGAAVGPGSYRTPPFTERQHESKRNNQPRFTFAQARRLKGESHHNGGEVELRLSDGYSALGDSTIANKKSILKTSPRFSFGTSTRDNAARVTIVRSSLDAPAQGRAGLNLKHPQLPLRQQVVKYS